MNFFLSSSVIIAVNHQHQYAICVCDITLLGAAAIYQRTAIVLQAHRQPTQQLTARDTERCAARYAFLDVRASSCGTEVRGFCVGS